ncbi:uncharacterized protein PITG_17989 [Phytophthora infestans T30-4]|uniref:Uncharacterized protein n=1 Tax=Phytophthora infestans (strain T30-4) TaxID=403677 RepID=D0NXF9_PHYIT|nr:uncharacterized protein PITG_17989 [Phytophthora infestans T30-4]EEY67759.1 conserved hypothetical protein [Phytophthora infestans T30-4]|eukprot:XP_002997921.1 conserved hypothetical protein [Phytophthora infestans T30-4]
MLVAATESDTAAAAVRGCDVEDILLGDGSAADFTESEASVLARKLVEEDVLQPFCCLCSFVYRANRVYRVNKDHCLVKEAQMVYIDCLLDDESHQDEIQRCRGHLLWLHDSAFQQLLTQFDRREDADDEGISGMDGVQALLRFGASDVSSGISFQMNSMARYKKVCVGTSLDKVDSYSDAKRHAVVSSERAAQAQREVRETFQPLLLLLVLLDALVTTDCYCGSL